MIDPEINRQLNDLRSGDSNTCGVFTLAANPETTTTVTRVGVSSGSVISIMPFSSGARYADITYIVPGTGEFVVNHAASVTTRTFRYEFKTGVKT